MLARSYTYYWGPTTACQQVGDNMTLKLVTAAATGCIVRARHDKQTLRVLCTTWHKEVCSTFRQAGMLTNCVARAMCCLNMQSDYRTPGFHWLSAWVPSTSVSTKVISSAALRNSCLTPANLRMPGLLYWVHRKLMQTMVNMASSIGSTIWYQVRSRESTGMT